MNFGLPAPTPVSARQLPPIVSIVVPTLNERDNVEVLFARLSERLGSLPWEMIVVDDDSLDGTWAWARAQARSDVRLRCLRRVNRRGLAGACVEGMLSSSAPVVVVMDGDLQHDETILPSMVKIIVDGEADLVVGTRHEQLAPEQAFGRARAWLSAAGTLMARAVTTQVVSDPMSGYFAIRQNLCEALAPRLGTEGFKILLDILSKAPAGLRVMEVGYGFGRRLSGTSKLDARVLVDYLGLLIHALSRERVPPRFGAFLLVGSSGLVVHACVLQGLHGAWPQAGFYGVDLLATYGAMGTNFLLNNLLTFRDQRFRGWRMILGMGRFAAVCSIGVIAGLSVSTWILDPARWWLAGLSGALVSAVWNFGASSALVWNGRTARARRAERENCARSEGLPSGPSRIPRSRTPSCIESQVNAGRLGLGESGMALSPEPAGDDWSTRDQ